MTISPISATSTATGAAQPVSSPKSAPSSSASASSSSDTTSNATNADGSVTTTVKDTKGSIVSVTTSPAGNSDSKPDASGSGSLLDTKA